MKSSLQRASLCALVLFTAVPANATVPNAMQISAYEKASEIERVKLLMSLAKSPDAEQVTYLLHRFPLQGRYAENRRLYLEGLVLRSKGKLREAVKNFRAALANDPKLTLVRADLAETLVALQQDDSALHQLRLLAADAPDEQTASGIRSFIDQVDSRRPYTFNGYISLAPSTNVNSGSRHATVYSPSLNMTFATQQPKSGVGVAAGMNGAYSKHLGDDFMFVASAGTDVRLYADTTFNSFGFSQSADMRYLLNNGYLALGAVSSQQLDNQFFHASYLSYGPRLSASLQVTAQNHLSFGLLHEWRHPIGAGSENSRAINADASWTHAWDASLNATVFGGFDWIKTSKPFTSYKTISAGLSVSKEMPFGISTTVTAQVGRTRYEGVNGLALVTREDRKIASSITLTKRDVNIHGFAPSATYSFSDNFSNINSYDSVSHAVDFRLTRDF